jgi:putative SOS response-associated peptidase YedK
MCGRFVLISKVDQIAEEFNLADIASSSVASGDIHPGQKAACIISENRKNRLLVLPWGFSPQWSKQTTKSKLLINARSETLSEKPTFREAFQKRRCLIAADGFYEWSKEKKQYYFYLQNRKPFGLAGIYEETELPATGKEASFVIITTSPNRLISPIHNRMPVIIPHDKQSMWLDNEKYDKSQLQSLTAPYPAQEMEMRPGAFIAGH